MASTAPGRVALMSIHPEYAQAIVEGSKRVEFRKRPLGADVTHVVVYATAPVSRVVCIFSVDGQETETPRTLWDRFRDVAGISRAKFFAYFDDRSHGTGIKVGEVLTLEDPWHLVEDLGVARPPQSYQYLGADRARPLLAAAAHA